jgi:hypothetical protein
MSLDITNREEIKNSDVVKAKSTTDTQSVNRAFEIGKTHFYPAINACFEKSPAPVCRIVHESLPEGQSNFQNFLMGELFPAKTTWTHTRRLGIFPINIEVMRAITEHISNNKAGQVKEIVDCYKDSLSDFKEIRFALIKRMYPSVEHDPTDQKPSAQEPVPVKPKQARDDAFGVKVLKELVMIANEKCQGFCRELKKDLDEMNHSQSFKTALTRYLSVWENYFLSALEINNHLQSLNDILNEATKQLLPNLSQRVPAFAIWRLLTGAFRSFCYMPLRHGLQVSSLRLIREFCQNYIASKARSLKCKDEVLNEKEVLAFLRGETKNNKNYDENNSLDTTYENISLCSKVIQALIDMSLNEVTVHFVGSKTLNLKVCKDMIEPLKIQLKDLCDDAVKKLGGSKELVNLFESELSLLQAIFPPCMWDDIEIKVRESVMCSLKEELGSLANKFAALTKEQKKEEAGTIQAHPEDRYVAPIVQQLKNEQGKAIFKVDEQKLFVAFLFNKHPMLYKQYVEKRIALNTANNREETVEDIEIEIKNKSLGIVNSEENNNFFMIAGMNQAELSKL